MLESSRNFACSPDHSKPVGNLEVDQLVLVLQSAMDSATDLLQYLSEEPEEQEWATAGPKRDRNHDSRPSSALSSEALKPLALLECYYREGKISHGHIDDR